MINDFLKLVYEIPLGVNYPAVFSFSVLVCLAVLTVLSLTVNAIRFNKGFVLALVLALYFLCAFKIACDIYFKKPIKLDRLILALLFCALSLFHFIPLMLIKPRSSPKKAVNNRLIDKLSHENCYNRGSEIFSSNPFRRVEFLNTARLGDVDEAPEFGINFSGVLTQTDRLKQKHLSEKDRCLIADIELQVEKFSREKMSDVEREQFSSNLNRLIKLSAKTW